VLSNRRCDTEKGLTFKVQWLDTGEVAHMQFDMARKKYPHIVLDYLVARIRQRPANQDHDSQQIKKQLNLPVTQHSDSPQHSPNDSSPIAKFFGECPFCTCAKHCSKMLDYDAIVGLEANIAYPVVFRVGKDRSKRKSGGTVRHTHLGE
jgi:hypothetical protein